MHENHAHEQYFFDEPTLETLAGLVARFERPCLLGAPMLARRLHERAPRRPRQAPVRLLDIDERFRDVPGFLKWDIYRPVPLEESFDVILCDPPFFNVSLSQLFTAVRLLARFDYAQPLMISYLARRESALRGTFARFNLEPSGMFPTYRTVQSCAKNDIQFYANFPIARAVAPATA
jgi:hypothetical protein